MKKYELYIFDVDGTIADRDTNELLPGVAEWFAVNAPKEVAFATNQGGVGLRHWMESEGFGEPEKYPTESQIYARLHQLRKKLIKPETTFNVCVSFRYQSKSSGKWSPRPHGTEGDTRWDKESRKPQPRMIHDAIYREGLENAVMVGDSEEDRQAAANAGIDFVLADEFFRR